ncbi:hypothetical protein D3C80_1139380 [compost metagenome]
MGRGAATAALVEGDDAVQVGIKVAAALGVAASARASVDEHHGQTFRRAAFVDIKHMRRFHGQIVPGVGFDLRVEGLHCALRVRIIRPWAIINLNCAFSTVLADAFERRELTLAQNSGNCLPRCLATPIASPPPLNACNARRPRPAALAVAASIPLASVAPSLPGRQTARLPPYRCFAPAPVAQHGYGWPGRHNAG